MQPLHNKACGLLEYSAVALAAITEASCSGPLLGRYFLCCWQCVFLLLMHYSEDSSALWTFSVILSGTKRLSQDVGKLRQEATI